MPSATEQPRARRRARLRHGVRRTVLARRRPVAAVCSAVAVLAAIHAARPEPPRTVAVRVAARDLAAGVVLTDDDLVTRRYPVGVAPRGSAGDAVGRTLAGPVRRGEPVTDVRLVSPSLAAAYPDRVVLPVRISDADAVGLLRVGDRVDVVAADPRRGRASYVANAAPVVAIPEPHDESDGVRSSTLPGRLVVLAVLPAEVEPVTAAAATALLTAVISR